MKKIVLILAVFLLASTVLNSQSNFHNVHYLDPYNPEYVKGEVLIKFKDEVKVESTLKSGVSKTGISSIDLILEPYQLESITKVFKETREQRQRKIVRTIRDFKGNEIEVLALFNIYKLKFDTIWDAKQIIEDLQKDENVEFVEPNYLVYTNEVIENSGIANDPPKQTPVPSTTGDSDFYPNDPLYQNGSQWYLDAINAPAAWDSVTGDTTQIIAIIDTGVDWDHPDLDDNIWSNWNEIPDNGIDDDNNGYIDDIRGWDFVNNDNNPNDDNSHGTHCAGIAAAEGNNGIGICGVAWNASILPVKVLQSSGGGSFADVAAGIEYASNNGATVINMSLGSYGESLTVKIALENAYAGTGDGEGSILVAAAGNDHRRVSEPDPCRTYGCDPMPMFPGAYSWVIGVMAEDAGPCNGFSNWDFDGPVALSGLNYEVQAKGVGILSCKPNGNYWPMNGTSMAAPEVAGAVALMRQYQPSQSGEQIFAKLIQGANNGLMDIYNSLTISLIPDLYYVEHTIVDTLPGCDADGSVDAGETIQLYVNVKNAGGLADSVWTKISFAEFEDTTTAIIYDSISFLGSISAYANKTGETDPFRLKIKNTVVNNRQIGFTIQIYNHQILHRSYSIGLTVTNATEVGGLITGNTTWTPDNLYVIKNNIRISEGACLTVRPGTTILFEKDRTIENRGCMNFVGIPDSLITLSGPYSNGYQPGEGIVVGYNQDSQDSVLIKYCNFKGMTGSVLTVKEALYRLIKIENNIFQDNVYANISIRTPLSEATQEFSMCKNLFINNKIESKGVMLHHPFKPIIDSNDNFSNNIFANNTKNFYWADPKFLNFTVSFLGYSYPITFHGNCFLNPEMYEMGVEGIQSQSNLSNNYFGMKDSISIQARIYDFYYDPAKPIINFSPYLSRPPQEAHGLVWKVEINDILINKYDNPYNSPTGLGVIGAETLKFDVYFNRAMDTTISPLLSFGIAEPYTQHIIGDSSIWSSDSTIWTAYYNVGQETGDGIQKVRIANARDDEHFEIPVDNWRFEFLIQAASSASIEFYATPGIDKVELEWPPTPSEDALGYNLYRSYNLTDSTYSDTLLINTELILDTVYSDYNVIPDTTYHYFYKTLGTDMVETDYSKKVTATPFNAANGDANGDLTVNVLDITTIVSYTLNQSPSPFLFDAADVNYDNEINILDIIGLVQLINGKKSSTTQPLPEVSNDIAYYHLSGNKLSVESEGNVAALQFKIKVRSQKSGDGRREAEVSMDSDLSKLKIFSLTHGFEFSYGIVDNEIIGILCSLTGIEVPEGITELFRFEGIDGTEVEITEIFGGDLNGDYVPVLKKGENTIIFASDTELQANPNPFTSSTQINYTVPENGIVEIRLFDMTGTEITKLENTFLNAGNYSINWNGTNDRGQLLKSGIYLLQLKVKSVSGNNYNKEVKVVFTK